MGTDRTNSRPAPSDIGPPHVLSPALAAALLAEATRAWPNEACGLLLGGVDAGPDGIAAILPAANLAPDPSRQFEIDPAALISAHRAARHGGPPVLGHYHSHPSGDPAPSATDRAEARGRGALWAIIGLTTPAAGHIAVWRDGPEGFSLFSTPAHG